MLRPLIVIVKIYKLKNIDAKLYAKTLQLLQLKN